MALSIYHIAYMDRLGRVGHVQNDSSQCRMRFLLHLTFGKVMSSA